MVDNEFYYGDKTYKVPGHDIEIGDYINSYRAFDPVQREMKFICRSFDLNNDCARKCDLCVFSNLDSYKKYREVAMLRFKANNYNNQTVYTPDGHKLGGEA